MDVRFPLTWVRTEERVEFCKKPPDCLPRWPRRFASRQQALGVPVAPRARQRLPVSVFRMLAIRAGASWYPVAVSAHVSRCHVTWSKCACAHWHLCFFSGEVSVQVVGPIFKSAFLIVEF